MSTFLQTFAAQVAEPLAGLAAAGVAWLCAWGARWVFVRTKNEQIRAGMLRLDDAVIVAVREVEQTVVSTLKKQTEDGKLSAADAAAVRQAAIGTINSHFGPKGMDELKKVLGVDDLAGMVAARIEAAVQQTRAATAASAPQPQPVAIAVSK